MAIGFWDEFTDHHCDHDTLFQVASGVVTNPADKSEMVNPTDEIDVNEVCT